MSQPTSDILIVDDEETIREMAAEMLAEENANYQIRTACNGAVALAMIRERAPALILLDINMPVMSGEELFAQLQHEGFTNLPVLFMSASLGEGVSKRFNEQTKKNLVAFLPKPFDIEVLSQRVASYLMTS